MPRREAVPLKFHFPEGKLRPGALTEETCKRPSPGSVFPGWPQALGEDPVACDPARCTCPLWTEESSVGGQPQHRPVALSGLTVGLAVHVGSPDRHQMAGLVNGWPLSRPVMFVEQSKEPSMEFPSPGWEESL